MPKIVLENVTKRWKDFYGADHLNIEIEDKSFITLLGPSGCGKTTTLRMIAGLETPTSGKITIGDDVVFDSEMGINVPPNKRDVGFLFQNYALWPHMTVYKNIMFGLLNVNEKMPLHASELERMAKLSKIVLEKDKIIAAHTNSIDKDGKADEKKELLELIDTFEISMYSAKELKELKLWNLSEENVSSLIIEKSNEYDSKAQKEKADLEAKGYQVGEDFDIYQNNEKVFKKRKLDKEEMDLKLRHVARVVKIGEFMERYPAELSGGQQQRVAIARTLAPGPKVLFMDEPLSNLDAKLRLEMRAELKRLHVETGATFVYVTHDQLEAMTLATKICLINNGVIQQYDPPLTVYTHPANQFVADFVGNPAINFIPVEVEQAEKYIKVTGLDGELNVKYISKDEKFNLADSEDLCEKIEEERLKKKEEIASEKGYVEKRNSDRDFIPHIATISGDEPKTKTRYYLGIRPEAIKIHEKEGVSAEVYAALPSGMETTVRLRVGEFILTSVVFGGEDYKSGSEVKISIEGDGILLFDSKDGRLVSSGKVA